MLGNLTTNLLWVVSFTVVIATCASLVAGTRVASIAHHKGWLNEFTSPVAGMIGASALVPIIATLALGGTPGVIALACGVVGAGISLRVGCRLLHGGVQRRSDEHCPAPGNAAGVRFGLTLTEKQGESATWRFFLVFSNVSIKTYSKMSVLFQKTKPPLVRSGFGAGSQLQVETIYL